MEEKTVRLHKVLLERLNRAIAGEKIGPYELPENMGISVNFKLMHSFSLWISDPSEENMRLCLNYIVPMKKYGHLIGEAGSPGMHWSFNIGAVAGGLLYALKRANSIMQIECGAFLRNEYGLDRNFRWKGHTILPCPRVMDQKGEAPVDGYRDVFVDMIQGRVVNKPKKYWDQYESAAVRTIRDILVIDPDMKLDFSGASVPMLMLPIIKKDLPDGGYEAHIEDTPKAREVMGHDACHRVICSNERVAYGVDWNDRLIDIKLKN